MNTSEIIGEVGQAITALNPRGQVEIDGVAHFVRAAREHIEAGASVVVSGWSIEELIVERHDNSAQEQRQTRAREILAPTLKQAPHIKYQESPHPQLTFRGTFRGWLRSRDFAIIAVMIFLLLMGTIATVAGFQGLLSGRGATSGGPRAMRSGSREAMAFAWFLAVVGPPVVVLIVLWLLQTLKLTESVTLTDKSLILVRTGLFWKVSRQFPRRAIGEILIHPHDESQQRAALGFWDWSTVSGKAIVITFDHGERRRQALGLRFNSEEAVSVAEWLACHLDLPFEFPGWVTIEQTSK